VKLEGHHGGAIKMCYPADHEQAVFCNPVLVKNRDLSILIITLAAERRAIRHLTVLTVKYKKELRKQQQPNEQETSGSVKEQLAAYKAELENNPSAALQGET
jgi:tRNA G26 N,N-dimethylase Trm1